MTSESGEISRSSPIRILHVVGGMDRGGAETWLMHLLRRVDPLQYRMDFLVHTESTCAFDDEIRSLRSQVIPCMHPTRPLAYGPRFRRILSESGPYDVVHSHVHFFSGLILKLAHQAGVPIRIAHSHNEGMPTEGRMRPLRRAYVKLMRRWIRDHATNGLAASRLAADALFTPRWERDRRWRVLFCSIDLHPFSEVPDRNDVRAELGIPEGAFVVGHVGRFYDQKNHEFLLQIFREIDRREPEARLLMIGDGPLRPLLERQASELGLCAKLIFAGVRPDVPRLLLGAMDTFVFPSRYEGLPLVLMEAQAAGLTCIISDAISSEIDVTPLMRRMSLIRPPAEWAETVLAVRSAVGIPQRTALEIVRGSPFNAERGAEGVKSIWRGDGNH